MFVKHFLKRSPVRNLKQGNPLRQFLNGASSGQSVVEYLVFFAVIAVLTLVSLCTLYPSAHQACERALEDAVEDIY